MKIAVVHVLLAAALFAGSWDIASLPIDPVPVVDVDDDDNDGFVPDGSPVVPSETHSVVDLSRTIAWPLIVRLIPHVPIAA